jgi:hypothetical protein
MFLGAPESNSRLCRAHFDPDLHRWSGGVKITHAHQIVGRAGEGKDPIYAIPRLLVFWELSKINSRLKKTLRTEKEKADEAEKKSKPS